MKIFGSASCSLEQGVNTGYGTDLCWSPKTCQADGLLIHQKVCGAAEALRHATVNNAKVVRMEGLVGVIAPGAFADRVIVDANPLDGLECFSPHASKVIAVIQSGRAVRDDLALLSQPPHPDGTTSDLRQRQGTARDLGASVPG